MRTHPKDNMEKAESDAIKFPYVDEGGIGKLYGGTWSRATGTNTPSPPVTCQRQAAPRLPRSPSCTGTPHSATGTSFPSHTTRQRSAEDPAAPSAATGQMHPEDPEAPDR